MKKQQQQPSMHKRKLCYRRCWMFLELLPLTCSHPLLHFTSLLTLSLPSLSLPATLLISLSLFTHQIFHCHIKIHLKSLLAACVRVRVRVRTLAAICVWWHRFQGLMLDSFHQQIIINSCLKLKHCQISNNNFHNHFHSALHVHQFTCDPLEHTAVVVMGQCRRRRRCCHHCCCQCKAWCFLLHLPWR